MLIATLSSVQFPPGQFHKVLGGGGHLLSMEQGSMMWLWIFCTVQDIGLDNPGSPFQPYDSVNLQIVSANQ